MTKTSFPTLLNAEDRYSVYVAMPHSMGGYVERKPILISVFLFYFAVISRINSAMSTSAMRVA
jgi:hypothetical protein